MQRKGITRSCEYCGKSIYVIPSKIAIGAGRFCSCSCHASSRIGPLNPAWKGGRTQTRRGYILRWAPSHPFANANGFVYEHRLVMEQHIGRYLTANEVVHHQNETKNDNRIENLQLTTASNHRHIHNGPPRWSRTYDRCIACGTTERRHESRGLCRHCFYLSKRARP
jgi:hypothetical protein